MVFKVNLIDRPSNQGGAVLIKENNFIYSRCQSRGGRGEEGRKGGREEEGEEWHSRWAEVSRPQEMRRNILRQAGASHSPHLPGSSHCSPQCLRDPSHFESARLSPSHTLNPRFTPPHHSPTSSSHPPSRPPSRTPPHHPGASFFFF
ncbi:hypothetical protein Naga_102236g1, partial [Nannochloropsis gaditana]